MGDVDGPKIIGVVRGKDGKRYPPDLPRDQAEYQRIVRLSHRLCHSEGHSLRQAERILLDTHGIRRSRGAIARDLLVFECEHCHDRPEPEPAPAPPAQPQPEQVSAQHYAGPAAGFLTGDLDA